MLANLKKDTTIAGDSDVLGGARQTDAYLMAVESAYFVESQSGSVGIAFGFKDASNKAFNQTIYMTSGTAKGKLPYYVKEDGSKVYLPGYIVASAIVELALGKDLSEVETETKVVKLKDKNTKKEVPTEVPFITELVGKQFYLGIYKVIEDHYKNAGETQEKNEISKVFDGETKQTTTEKAANEPAAFFDKWVAKHKGKVNDKSGKSENQGKQGRPTRPSTTPQNLFD